jgi:hypothetical protein
VGIDTGSGVPQSATGENDQENAVNRFFTFLLPVDFSLGTFDPPDVCFSVTGFIGTAGAGAFGRAGNCPVHSSDSR